MAEAYITRQQAAAQLSVSLRTLDGLIRSGALPAYRIGAKLVRIAEQDLTAYITQRQVVPPRKPGRVTAVAPPRPCGYVKGMKVV